MGKFTAEKQEVLQWLSRAFWDVPNAALLEGFRRGAFVFAGPEADAGLDLIECAIEHVAACGEDGLRDLRVDYSALFCGFDPSCPFPYESVYRGEKRLLMQPVRDEVLALYREAGYEPAQSEGNEPEDHLSFELSALAYLLAKLEGAVSDESCVGSDSRASTLGALKQRLLAEHLLRWMPEFCCEVSQRAQTDLYRGIASILPHVLIAT